MSFRPSNITYQDTQRRQQQQQLRSPVVAAFSNNSNLQPSAVAPAVPVGRYQVQPSAQLGQPTVVNNVAAAQRHLEPASRGQHNHMIMLEDLLPILQQYGLTGNNILMAAIYAASQEHDHKKALAGVWITCHKKAELHDHVGDRQGFVTYIKWLASVFWCDECAGHFRQYLRENPPEDDFYMSVYMFKFHNAVNKRLNRPEMTWETYVELYRTHPEKICPNCSAHGSSATGAGNASSASNKEPISKGGRRLSVSDYDSLFLQ